MKHKSSIQFDRNILWNWNQQHSILPLQSSIACSPISKYMLCCWTHTHTHTRSALNFHIWMNCVPVNEFILHSLIRKSVQCRQYNWLFTITGSTIARHQTEFNLSAMHCCSSSNKNTRRHGMCADTKQSNSTPVLWYGFENETTLSVEWSRHSFTARPHVREFNFQMLFP